MTDELKFHPEFKPTFTINIDGTVTLHPGVTLDEATAAFWTGVVAKGPAARIAELEAESKARLTDASAAWDMCETLRARIAELEVLLKECADDLAAELDARYRILPDDKVHPAMQHRYDRDMAPVRAARAALEKKDD